MIITHLDEVAAILTALLEDLVPQRIPGSYTGRYFLYLIGRGEWNSEGPEEEGGTDGSWMSDGSDFGWETETEDEEQDEELSTPTEKPSSKNAISPEDATAIKQTTGRMLFVEGK